MLDMDTSTKHFIVDEYIRAAPDFQLSSSETHLLSTLLSEEDQHDYHQLLQLRLPSDILQLLHQVKCFLDCFSSQTQNISKLNVSLLVDFVAQCFSFGDVDGTDAHQTTPHSTTFHRLVDSHRLSHTFTQISRFAIEPH